ncbi:MAG: phosphonate C-P lyase system protein PhnH [Proteobacteria bacterium]|nr:phosphonate C-P lyase system protein PhnH [Pseudomonadota bacterium]
MLVNMIESGSHPLAPTSATGSSNIWPSLGNRSAHQAGWGERHAPSGLHPTTLEYLTQPATRQKFIWLAEECRHDQVIKKLQSFSHLKIVNTPEAASLALLDHISDLNILSRLPVGRENGLDSPATVIIQVEEIYEHEGVSFADLESGKQRNLNPVPLPRTFWHFRERASSSAETGLDVVFTSPTSKFTLPRTIKVAYPKFY